MEGKGLMQKSLLTALVMRARLNQKKQSFDTDELQIDWEKVVIVTRRYLHDDWDRIFDKLAKKIESDFTYQPFHVEKAIILLQEKEQVKLLYNNKDWTTVHKFYIGDACRGLLEVSKSTMRKADLIEARLKIKHNYTGFISAQINITNSKGNIFTIHTVSYTEGRWGNDGRLKFVISGQMDKGKGIMVFNDSQEEKANFLKRKNIKPLKINPLKGTYFQKKKKSPRKIYRVKNNHNKEIELVEAEKKEKAINLTMELGNIFPLPEELEVEHVSSPDSPIMTPIQISPSQSEIIRDSLVSLVDSEEEKEHNEGWIGKREINEEIFKKQLINWLNDNNLKLAPAYDNKASSTKNILDNEKKC
ncbi:hypothetical protein E6C27_scaffold321G00310 [Cucumis melo var. makuwa]|uniref:Uncharacterized protein n=1 Tax=Cucumis melo var. makuwa TaxID=1194695 RepID=A0A5A7V4L2_CUCMM|nr:hypothetical protein E6C27_scaffold321G00310 [Cucumis melo var. makuwa]